MWPIPYSLDMPVEYGQIMNCNAKIIRKTYTKKYFNNPQVKRSKTIQYIKVEFEIDAINKTKLYEANLFKHLYIDLYANNGYMLDSKHLKYF